VSFNSVGVLFADIPLTAVYPIVTATAPDVSVRLITAELCGETLETLAMLAIRRMILPDADTVESLTAILPPGLYSMVHSMWWMFDCRSPDSPTDDNNSGDQEQIEHFC